jgi:hypothetical protein
MRRGETARPRVWSRLPMVLRVCSDVTNRPAPNGMNSRDRGRTPDEILSQRVNVQLVVGSQVCPLWSGVRESRALIACLLAVDR